MLRYPAYRQHLVRLALLDRVALATPRYPFIVVVLATRRPRQRNYTPADLEDDTPGALAQDLIQKTTSSVLVCVRCIDLPLTCMFE